MKRWGASLVVLSSLAVLAPAARAAEPSLWPVFSDAGFSVRLPDKPQMQSRQIDAPEGTASMLMYMARSDDPLVGVQVGIFRYVQSTVAMPDSDAAREEFAREYIKGAGGEVKKLRVVKQKGGSACEFRALIPGNLCLCGRVFNAGERLFVLAVAAEDVLSLQEASDVVFPSFEAR